MPRLPILAQNILLQQSPKRVVLSGPSGFVGQRVLDSILEGHAFREMHGQEPGELVLLSSKPGTLMGRLYGEYGAARMRTVRASRADYFSQHTEAEWLDHLGSLGVGGKDSVFVNLAGLAGGGVAGTAAERTQAKNALHNVNYKAPVAAAKACNALGVGHFIQSSTQAVNAERAGQVPYSRGKAMTDFALSQLASTMPVTIACLGLIYCKRDAVVGQGLNDQYLNMTDLPLLPLTPIMGSGLAPLQPQEVGDAAIRLAFLALSDPAERPSDSLSCSLSSLQTTPLCGGGELLRVYDAVGPEVISMHDLLERFARFQGSPTFNPVFIDYRNMEELLNVKSLGNLSRQFVSLLRSEQDGNKITLGDPSAWGSILCGRGAVVSSSTTAGRDGSETDGVALPLKRLDQAFEGTVTRRGFPFLNYFRHLFNYPRAIWPSLILSIELLVAAWRQGALRKALLSVISPNKKNRRSAEEQANTFLARFGKDSGVTKRQVRDLLRAFVRHGNNRRAISPEAAKAALNTAGFPVNSTEFDTAFDQRNADGASEISFIALACFVFHKEWGGSI